MTDLLPSRDPVGVPAIRGTLTGLPFGYYRVRHLISRYDAWAEREGIPVYRRATPQMLASALRSMGFGHTGRGGQGALWTIDPSRLEVIFSHAEGTVSETPPEDVP